MVPFVIGSYANHEELSRHDECMDKPPRPGDTFISKLELHKAFVNLGQRLIILLLGLVRGCTHWTGRRTVSSARSGLCHHKFVGKLSFSQNLTRETFLHVELILDNFSSTRNSFKKATRNVRLVQGKT